MCVGCFLSQRWRPAPTTADWCVRAVRGGKNFLCTGPGCCFAVPPLAPAPRNHTPRPPQPSAALRSSKLAHFVRALLQCPKLRAWLCRSYVAHIPCKPRASGPRAGPEKGPQPHLLRVSQEPAVRASVPPGDHQAACKHRPARTGAGASTMRHRWSAAPVPAHVLIFSALPQPEHLHGRRISGAPVSSETHRTNAHSPRRLWSTHSRHCASARQASFHHLRPVSQCLLPAPRPLLQRYHVCPEHATATSVMLDGIVQRFCQQVRASCRAAHWYLLVHGCLQHRAWLHLSMLGYLALQQPPGQAECDPALQRRRWFAGTALALTCARSASASHPRPPICSAAVSTPWTDSRQACAAAATSWRDMPSGGASGALRRLPPSRRRSAAPTTSTSWQSHMPQVRL